MGIRTLVSLGTAARLDQVGTHPSLVSATVDLKGEREGGRKKGRKGEREREGGGREGEER